MHPGAFHSLKEPAENWHRNQNSHRQPPSVKQSCKRRTIREVAGGCCPMFFSRAFRFEEEDENEEDGYASPELAQPALMNSVQRHQDDPPELDDSLFGLQPDRATDHLNALHLVHDGAVHPDLVLRSAPEHLDYVPLAGRLFRIR